VPFTETSPRSTGKPGDRAIAELVDEGGRLAKDIAALERKKTRLDSIKQDLRELAGSKDANFTGKLYSATVEQKPDTICRVVGEDDLDFALKTAGKYLPSLFTLHPSKGGENSFELNALKCLAKARATALVDRFTVAARPWVRFR
jgi:hypothetical protein